jgi:hypothetical protein
MNSLRRLSNRAKNNNRGTGTAGVPACPWDRSWPVLCEAGEDGGLWDQSWPVLDEGRRGRRSVGSIHGLCWAGAGGDACGPSNKG